jgi:stage II sporulation protein D
MKPVARLAGPLLALLLSGCGGLFRGGPEPHAKPQGNPADTSSARHAHGRRGGPSALPYPDIRDSVDFGFPYPEFDSGPPSRGFDSTGAARGSAAWLDSARAWPRNTQATPLRPGVRVRPRPRELPGWARVLLYRGPKPVNVYSIGDVDVWAQPAPEGRADSSQSAQNPNAIAPPAGRRGKLTTLRGRITLRRIGGGIEISQGTKVLQTVATRRMRLISGNPYNLMEIGDNVYRGGLEIIADGDGLMAVNVIGVEDYLRDVLPYELGTLDREALEALKALAVVARTYAYKRMLQNPQGDFHLYSDVQDQVYRGVKSEYLLSDRAVRETRGLVLTYNDSLVMPYYHSTCGGRTASRHELWGGDSIPYLVSQPDTDAMGQSFCQPSKYTTWTQEWTPAQLAGILKRNLKSAGVSDFPAFKTVKGMQVTVRASCGRIRTLRIETDKGPIWVKGDKVRWALRPTDNEEKILQSAWFDIQGDANRVVAKGRAFGHGIGLCQMGAIGRARADQNFLQILQAYYKGIQLSELR